MSETEQTPRHFGAALKDLRHVQKSSGGGPPYSLFINRPLGGSLLPRPTKSSNPNQVTYLSALLTAAGLAVLALSPANWLTGIIVTMGLVLGYAFRLRGRSARTASGRRDICRGVARPHDRLGQVSRGSRCHSDQPLPQLRAPRCVAAGAARLYRDLDRALLRDDPGGSDDADPACEDRPGHAGSGAGQPAQDSGQAADGLRDLVLAVPAPRVPSGVLRNLCRARGGHSWIHRPRRREMAP